MVPWHVNVPEKRWNFILRHDDIRFQQCQRGRIASLDMSAVNAASKGFTGVLNKHKTFSMHVSDKSFITTSGLVMDTLVKWTYLLLTNPCTYSTSCKPLKCCIYDMWHHQCEILKTFQFNRSTNNIHFFFSVTTFTGSMTNCKYLRI